MLACHSRSVVLLLLCLAVGCRSAGTGRDSATDERRRIAQALNRARADLDAAIAELARRSEALDAGAVSTLLPEIARRDTLYRKLIHLRRINEDRVNSPALADSIDLRLTPPRLDIPATPLIESFADGRNWILMGYLIHRFGSTPHVLIVPAGFVTDLASVPDIAEPLLPRAGEYSDAAILHDYLYWTQSCTREQADNLMSIAMKEAGVAPWKDLLIHSAVRLGGQDAWNTNRTRKASGFIRTVDLPWDRSPSTTDWFTFQTILRETNSRPGAEPRVSPEVCALGNSTSVPR
ncbi:MAG: DUF1353 domain-containing protein [Gemmatimonadaceae bacterium]